MNAKRFSKVILADNTAGEICKVPAVLDAIVAAILGDGVLPEEISDLFTLEMVEVEDGWRGVVRWA